jgi:PAS domain S-box-containing protein
MIMNNQIPDFNSIFQYTPGNYLVLKPDFPDFSIVAVNDQYLKATFTTRDDIVGRGVFEVFPDNPADPHATGVAKLRRSLESVLQTKKPHEMALQKYDIPIPGGKGFELRYWLPKNIPVLNDDGEVDYIIHNVVNVTEQIVNRQEIEELRLDQKIYDLFLKAPVAIAIFKGDDNIIELANTVFLELVGRSVDMIGKPLLEALPEIKGQGFIELINKVKISGKTYHANEVPATLVRNGKEEIIYVDFVYQPYIENTGTISGILVIAIEVTAQVEARRRIEGEEKRFRNLVEEAPVATAVLVGEDMVVQIVNDAMLKTWGKDAAIIGKTFKEALPELEGQPFYDLLINVYRTGKIYRATEGKADLVVDGKLQTFYFNFTYSALRNEEGSIYGTLIMAVDVTEQVNAKQQLIQSEARLRLAVEAAHLGTYEYDIANNTIIYSPRLAEIFGFDPSKNLTPDAFIKTIYPPDLALRNKAYEEAAKTGKVFYEARIIVRGGATKWVRINAKHRVENGLPAYSIGTVMDITDEKRTAEIMEQKIKERTRELEEANLLLKQSNGELEQIAHAASHDLKEPLRKIRTFNQLIKKESYEILPPRSKNHLDKSSEAAERMASFLDALLEYTELKKQEQFSTVDLNATVSDAINDLELVITEKNALILPQPLPFVRGIPHQLHQLFYNLINNALKFSKDGVQPVIEVTAKKVDSEYVEQHPTLKPGHQYMGIQVKDNGIGFDEKHTNDIFTIFKRLHSKSVYKGTGIGLALCKKIALNHGGDIFASSSPGEAATFHIILPL